MILCSGLSESGHFAMFERNFSLDTAHIENPWDRNIKENGYTW